MLSDSNISMQQYKTSISVYCGNGDQGLSFLSPSFRVPVYRVTFLGVPVFRVPGKGLAFWGFLVLAVPVFRFPVSGSWSLL